MQPPHDALPWPSPDPSELKQTAAALQELALLSERAVTGWSLPAIEWTGRSSQAHSRALHLITDAAASVPNQLASAASSIEGLAADVRDARAHIAMLARSLKAAEATAHEQWARAHLATQLASSFRPGPDPASQAEAEHLRQRASRARLLAIDASNEAAHVRRRTVDTASELIGAIDRRDAIVADDIDGLLRAPTSRLVSGVELPLSGAARDRTWISRRMDATTAAIDRHLDGLIRAVSQLESVPWSERTWTESMALIHLSEELELHERFLTPGRQILDWDPVGDGRVIEAFGDLTTARHIAVVVPGIMNAIENFDDQLAGDARELWREAAAVDDRTAVVAWLGYDTPELLNAVSKRRAVEYEPDLRAFVASLPSDAHVTVVAHSYGTVLAAEAASRGLAADDLVLVGSPGTALDHVTDADLEPGAQVFAGVSDTDWIVGRSGWGSIVCPETVIGAGWLTGLRWLASPVTGPLSWVTDSCKTDADGDVKGLSHGINPAHADFGAVEISTEDVGGHSSYFDRDGASLEAMARIVTGTHHRQR